MLVQVFSYREDVAGCQVDGEDEERQVNKFSEKLSIGNMNKYGKRNMQRRQKMEEKMIYWWRRHINLVFCGVAYLVSFRI